MDTMVEVVGLQFGGGTVAGDDRKGRMTLPTTRNHALTTACLAALSGTTISTDNSGVGNVLKLSSEPGAIPWAPGG